MGGAASRSPRAHLVEYFSDEVSRPIPRALDDRRRLEKRTDQRHAQRGLAHDRIGDREVGEDVEDVLLAQADRLDEGERDRVAHVAQVLIGEDDVLPKAVACEAEAASLGNHATLDDEEGGARHALEPTVDRGAEFDCQVAHEFRLVGRGQQGRVTVKSSQVR